MSKTTSETHLSGILHTYKHSNLPMSDVIAAIHAAFKEDGYYKQHASSPEAYAEFSRSMGKNLPQLMTRHEWLIRLEFELSSTMFEEYYTHDGKEAHEILDRKAILRAAKRAAGVDHD